MNEQDKALVLEFKRRLPPGAGKHLRRLIVFGSRATGAAQADSDLDIAALVDTKTAELEQELENTVYEIMWDHDFKPVISLKVFAEAQFNEAVNRGYSFYRNVINEGIAV